LVIWKINDIFKISSLNHAIISLICRIFSSLEHVNECGGWFFLFKNILK